MINSLYSYLVLFAAFTVYYGSQSTLDYKYECLIVIAQYIFYLLTIKGIYKGIEITRGALQSNDKINFKQMIKDNRACLAMCSSALVGLIYNRPWHVLGLELLMFLVASLIVKLSELEEHKLCNVSYGVGMAHSFFEGYLIHILPSDGGSFGGFHLNIANYESHNQIRFPVKKLFIVVTKSLYCPTDLSEFNRPHRQTTLEACAPLPEVKKDVAGVKKRRYANSAYQLRRAGAAAVFLAAECATPLHTLHRVLQKQALYADLRHVDVERVRREFCGTVAAVVDKNRDCRGKLELVHFDDNDPDQYLPDILLARIKELEPNFEEIIKNVDT